MTAIRSPEITTRGQFAELCTARGYALAAEVGTDRGAFAEDFLRGWTLPARRTLFCIDPYMSYPEMPWDRSADYLFAVHRLSKFGRVCRLVRDTGAGFLTSVRLAGRGPEYPLRFDFVYLDGQHDEASVTADLDGWFPILSDHGMIAGHDFDPDHPGVVAAVTRFASDRGLPVYLTGDEDGPPSWYCYRTPPDNLLNLRPQADS